MPKEGVDYRKAGGILHSIARTSGWSLCVGAGISVPLFPSWATLVEGLFRKHHTGSVAKNLSRDMLGVYGADSLIQAACNRSGLTSAQFASLLSDELFGELRKSLSSSDWDVVSFILSRTGKKGINRKKWKQFLEVFRSRVAATTALDLAPVVLEFQGTSWGAKSIFSFNAEALFFHLINALSAEKATEGFSGIRPLAGVDVERLDLVTRSISKRNAERTPYVACHGMLPVPGRRPIRSGVSIDKLVFSEVEYLKLANSSFSWQSSAFLEAAGSGCMVFIGVSLSDPNMRRWLSWVHDNRLNELESFGINNTSSTSHFWIRPRPKDAKSIPWIEASVAHLGVRLVWLKNWGQAGETLRSMIVSPKKGA